MITSRKKVFSLFIEASEKYEACWDILYQMKYGFRDEKSTEAILDFQYQLYEILFKLDRTYDLISQEKKDLISKKQKFNQTWFENRMKALALYQDALLRGTSIGKCLGDSFVWFFYKNSAHLIRQHLSQKEIQHSPSGVGGIGELGVIKTLKFYNQHFVLYHGITTFLRLGDISLFDLSTQQISALGEIKSKLVDDKRIDVSVILKSSASNTKEPLAEPFKSKNFIISPQAKPRFDRQMKQMKSSFAEAEHKDVGESDFIGDIHIDDLNLIYKKVQSSRFITSKVGDGLLLIAYKARQKDFPSRLLSIIDFKAKIKRVEHDIYQIIDKTISNNTLYYGSVHYNTKAKTYILLGFIPFIWWRINPELIKAVIFHEIKIATIYNLIFFFRKLTASGFVCNQDSASGKWDIYKQNSDGENIAVENISFFIHLIMNNLYKEESIIKMMLEMTDIVSDLDVDSLGKVEFNLIQEF